MFITLEGPEGCGKTTLGMQLAQKFKVLGLTTLLTKETQNLQNTAFNNLLQANRVDPENPHYLSPEEDLYAFLMLREYHYNQVLKQALNTHEIVICDRYLLSTLVYQGIMRNAGLEYTYYAIEERKEFIPFPHIQLFVNTSVHICCDRITQRKQVHSNDFDNFPFQWHSQLHQAYKTAIHFLQDKKNLTIYPESNYMYPIKTNSIVTVSGTHNYAVINNLVNQLTKLL